MKNRVLVILLLFYSLASLANDGGKINSFFSDNAPQIDGILNDKVWQEAQSVTVWLSFPKSKMGCK